MDNKEMKATQKSTRSSKTKQQKTKPPTIRIDREIKCFLTTNTITEIIAMDCEMVGVGKKADRSMLARVSLVNTFGNCIYDVFVKPREIVKDYRTCVSGVREQDLLNGEEFIMVKTIVMKLIRKRILVGHSLKGDLRALGLCHPERNTRDISKCYLMKTNEGDTPSLKTLAKQFLGLNIQDGEHSSVEDARAAMKLYCTVSVQWEASLSGKNV